MDFYPGDPDGPDMIHAESCYVIGSTVAELGYSFICGLVGKIRIIQ